MRIFFEFCFITCYFVTVSFGKGPSNKNIPSSSDSDDITDYHVSLRTEHVKYGAHHFCSGVLVTPSLVLTAAHCVQGMCKSEILVVKGSNYVSGKNQGETMFVKHIYVHEEYRRKTKVNDIAMIQLRSRSYSSRKMLLSKSSIEKYENQTCQTMASEIFDTIDVNFVRSDDCNQTSPFEGRILKGMFCAIPSSNSTSSSEEDFSPTNICVGDSGGALACQNTLVGIVSWGLDTCKEETSPTVFTDISLYRDWIRSRIDSILRKYRRRHSKKEDDEVSSAQNLLQHSNILLLCFNYLVRYFLIE